MTAMEPFLLELRRAFPLSPLPTMTLKQAVLVDQAISRIVTDEEWEAAKRADAGIDWSNVSDQDLIAARDGLAHLDDDDFVYWLPAFFRFATYNIDCSRPGPRGDLFSAVVFTMTNLSNYNLSRLKRLSEKQVDCAIRFLRIIASGKDEFEADSARRALEKYWLTPKARNPSLIERP